MYFSVFLMCILLDEMYLDVVNMCEALSIKNLRGNHLARPKVLEFGRSLLNWK